MSYGLAQDLVYEQVRAVLEVPRIADVVAAYFDPRGPFAGTSFDLFGDNPPDVVTVDDLLATTLLDISWRPSAFRTLVAGGERLTEGLTAIPADIDLWNADRDVVRAASDLHGWLDAVPGVGPVIASKLMARKRPRLVPVYDRVVQRALGAPKGKFWVTLAAVLTDASLRDQIEALRPVSAHGVSLLRLLDVAIWVRCSRSRSACEARRTAAVPEPVALSAGE